MSDKLEIDISMPVLDQRLQVQETLGLSGGATAIFGPSGAGKSRLLRAIAGVDWKDQGRALGRIVYGTTVLLDSQNDIYVPMHQRPLAYVTQQPALFPHLTALENIRYAVKRAFPGGPQASMLADLLALHPLFEKYPDSLSGGEAQRVALARALARGASLVLLDEPMAALDKDSKLDLMHAMETIQAELDVSAILVSHAVGEVTRLAGQTLVLSAGKVLAHGPTLEVFDSIDQTAAMGLFEAGSVIEGTIRGHDAALELTTVDIGGDSLSMPLLDRLAIGSTVRLRIRARDVAIALEKPRQISIRNILPATFLGTQGRQGAAFVEVRLGLGGCTLNARITRAAFAELAPQPGAQIFALIKSVSFDRRMI